MPCSAPSVACTSLPTAQTKPANSRAMAVTATVSFMPRPASARQRAHSRTCAPPAPPPRSAPQTDRRRRWQRRRAPRRARARGRSAWPVRSGAGGGSTRRSRRRFGEAGSLAAPGHDRGGGDQLDAAQRLERLHHGRGGPCWDGFLDGRLHARQPLLRVPGGQQHLMQHELLGRMLEELGAQPRFGGAERPCVAPQVFLPANTRPWRSIMDEIACRLRRRSSPAACRARIRSRTRVPNARVRWAFRPRALRRALTPPSARRRAAGGRAAARRAGSS